MGARGGVAIAAFAVTLYPLLVMIKRLNVKCPYGSPSTSVLFDGDDYHYP